MGSSRDDDGEGLEAGAGVGRDVAALTDSCSMRSAVAQSLVAKIANTVGTGGAGSVDSASGGGMLGCRAATPRAGGCDCDGHGISKGRFIGLGRCDCDVRGARGDGVDGGGFARAAHRGYTGVAGSP